MQLKRMQLMRDMKGASRTTLVTCQLQHTNYIEVDRFNSTFLKCGYLRLSDLWLGADTNKPCV